MRYYETQIKAKRLKVDAHRHLVDRLDQMLQEFQKMCLYLEAQISVEEKKNGITDVHHFAYSTFAKALRARHANLKTSVSAMKNEREAALKLLSEAEPEIAKARNVGSRMGTASRRKGLTHDITLSQTKSSPSAKRK